MTQPIGPQTEEQHPARHVDPAAIDRYRAAHPICALKSCKRKAVVHHIIERGECHIDRDFNFLELCDFGPNDGHHQGPQGIHVLGPDGFIAEHGDNLTLALIKKITAAVAYGKTLKLGGRPQRVTESA